mmetsp:Transcript_73842/g.228241  ORF Transcript_73842/g.228241 Transcript_73842/m.228241 type:complete len:202 (+) Transcript_73842:150-755(+)
MSGIGATAAPQFSSGPVFSPSRHPVSGRNLCCGRGASSDSLELCVWCQHGPRHARAAGIGSRGHRSRVPGGVGARLQPPRRSLCGARVCSRSSCADGGPPGARGVLGAGPGGVAPPPPERRRPWPVCRDGDAPARHGAARHPGGGRPGPEARAGRPGGLPPGAGGGAALSRLGELPRLLLAEACLRADGRRRLGGRRRRHC